MFYLLSWILSNGYDIFYIKTYSIPLGSTYKSYEFFVKTLVWDSTCAQVMLLSLFLFPHVFSIQKDHIKIYTIPFIFYFYKIYSKSKLYWIALNFTCNYSVCLVCWFTILVYSYMIDILNILSYAHHKNKIFYLIV